MAILISNEGREFMDRRNSDRRSVRWPTTIHDELSPVRNGVVENIGREGLFITMWEQWKPVGEDVILRFMFPISEHLDDVCELKARILHHTERGFAVRYADFERSPFRRLMALDDAARLAS